MVDADPKSLSREEFELIRLQAMLGEKPAKLFLAQLVAQNPAAFASGLDMKSIVLETMARAVSPYDEGEQRNAKEALQGLLLKYEPAQPPGVMERMLIDVTAMAHLRAAVFALLSLGPGRTAKVRQAFQATGKSATTISKQANQVLIRYQAQASAPPAPEAKA